ncbi:hypothetical protein EMPS_05946 [Entomortierella parvispora]|uniref:Glyoxalase/fosfomycin resistance/dioxygenase domain-containing protein n=1 Tax=Entomortierella parvispora TaxID=205924 RepID=A0A9P3HBU5_9FUNG|nr:hypothetical protein EMPS_05946 [Entomortierella parvispora]
MSAISISPGVNASHNKFVPGLHHLALHMDSREQVNLAYRKLRDFYVANEGQEMGRILDEPAEYRYMPGYYAVYFTDPDGMKLELVHTPASLFP